MRTVRVADLKVKTRDEVEDAIQRGEREVLVSWEELADVVSADDEAE